MGKHERAELAAAQRRQRDQAIHHAVPDVVGRVDALVADDFAVLHVGALAESAAGREPEQEGVHLSREARPGVAIAAFEARPARAALDAVDRQQLPSTERQQRAFGAAPRATRERLEGRSAGNARADGMQGIDTLRRQPLAVGIRQQLQRPRARDAAGSARRAGHPTASGAHPSAPARPRPTRCWRNGSIAAPQPVEGLHARETEERGITLEREFAQAVQGVLARLPRGGRIDDEQRAVVAAELRRDQQDAGSDVAITRRRRHAEKMQVFDAAQREQASAALGRADQVVIGERRTIVTVGIRIDVTNRVTRAGAERALGTRSRHRSHAPAPAGTPAVLRR